MKYLFSLIFAYLPFEIFAGNADKLLPLTLPDNSILTSSTNSW